MSESTKSTQTEDVPASAEALISSRSVLDVAAQEPTSTHLLGRILAHGEALAARLPSPPDALWDEGSELYLHRDAPMGEWGSQPHKADFDEIWEELEAQEADPILATDTRSGQFPMWLRPLWGFGVVALLAVVWWRLPAELPSRTTTSSQPPSVRTRSAKAPAQPPSKARARARYRLVHPRLFPAHRLRPKGIPMVSPSRRGIIAPTSAPHLSAVLFRLYVRRGARTWELHGGERLQADDQLRFAYQHASSRVAQAHVMVVMVDSRGEISPIFPAQKQASIRLQRTGDDQLHWLPGGAVLDASLLSERVFVCVSHQLPSQEEVKAAIRTTLSRQPLEQIKALHLGCRHQQSWWLQKRSRLQPLAPASRPAKAQKGR